MDSPGLSETDDTLLITILQAELSAVFFTYCLLRQVLFHPLMGET